VKKKRRIVAVITCFPYARQSDIPFKTKPASNDANSYDLWQARPGTLVANMVIFLFFSFLFLV